MKLLGALGIDWKILIIQSLNFLVLFILLYLLFFKPFIRTLRKEKDELEEVRKSKEEIEKEKEEWQRKKSEELLKARKRIEAILTEAERVAKKTEEEERKKISEEEKETLALIRKQSQAILTEYKESFAKDYKNKIVNSLKEIFEKNLSEKAKEEIERSFWRPFIKKFENLDFSQLGLDEAIKEDKKIKVRIKSALPLDKWQKKEIESLIKRKLANFTLKLIEERDKNLIAGFSLEILGFLVEENLKEKIESIF